MEFQIEAGRTRDIGNTRCTVFLLAEKSKLITTLMSEFVYDLFEKRKNHLNFQTFRPRRLVIYICLYIV